MLARAGWIGRRAQCHPEDDGCSAELRGAAEIVGARGKTTLLEVLAGNERPGGGNARDSQTDQPGLRAAGFAVRAGDTVSSILNAALAPRHLEDRESHGAPNLDFQLLFLTPNPGKRVYTP